MNKEKKHEYGLMTAVSMIVGICIGSGIFFKADDVLLLTGGSIFHGAVLFILGAVTIVFGGLTIGEMASRCGQPGGVIAYGTEFIHPAFGTALGWFQVFIYYPAMIAVVASVIGIYANMLFGWGLSLAGEMLLGFGFMLLSFWYNTWHPRFGGIFQRYTTIIKLIPLFLIAIFGLVKGNPFLEVGSAFLPGRQEEHWLSGIGAVAFSYDGWIAATSISGDMKNPKRDLPRALILGPVIILVIYLAYFVGISRYLGAAEVTARGDAHVYLAAGSMFGRLGASAVLLFVIISVMGTVNGLIMAMLRLPGSLAAEKGRFPAAAYLTGDRNGRQTMAHAALFSLGICTFWFVMHFVLKNGGWLRNSDVSEISVSVHYLFYVILYGKVMAWYSQRKIKSLGKGILCPILAIIGAGIVVYGSILDGRFFICLLLFLGITGTSFFYGVWHGYPSYKGRRKF